MLRSEIAMYRSLWRWARRRPPVGVGEGDRAFSYLQPVHVLLWFFIGMSAFEIPIFDFLAYKLVPWEPARWIVLGLGVWGLVWMLGLLASFHVHPHVVTATGIKVRNGHGVEVTVGWEEIESVRKRSRQLPSSKAVQPDGDKLHIAVNSQTTVDIVLRRPREFALPRVTGTFDEIRMHVDDADEFMRVACREGSTGASDVPVSPTH